MEPQAISLKFTVPAQNGFGEFTDALHWSSLSDFQTETGESIQQAIQSRYQNWCDFVTTPPPPLAAQSDEEVPLA